MKTPLLTLAVFLCIVFLATTVMGGPNLAIPEPSFDFGYVPQHSKISHVFWLHSTGDSLLQITQVVPGWGCTKAPLDKTELAVGDSTRLEIILDTGRFMRKVTKKPRVKTNEGPPDKQVEVICNVVERPDSTYPIVIKPYKLDLTQFGQKVRDQVAFRITNVSDRTLTASVVAYAGEYFEVKLPDAIKPGESAEAKIKLKQSAVGEEFEKSFTIVLDDPLSSRFTVPVKRKLRPSVKQTADPIEPTGSTE